MLVVTPDDKYKKGSLAKYHGVDACNVGVLNEMTEASASNTYELGRLSCSCSFRVVFRKVRDRSRPPDDSTTSNRFSRPHSAPTIPQPRR
jgi:hypothetical protein